MDIIDANHLKKLTCKWITLCVNISYICSHDHQEIYSILFLTKHLLWIHKDFKVKPSFHALFSLCKCLPNLWKENKSLKICVLREKKRISACVPMYTKGCDHYFTQINCMHWGKKRNIKNCLFLQKKNVKSNFISLQQYCFDSRKCVIRKRFFLLRISVNLKKSMEILEINSCQSKLNCSWKMSSLYSIHFLCYVHPKRTYYYMSTLKKKSNSSPQVLFL